MPRGIDPEELKLIHKSWFPPEVMNAELKAWNAEFAGTTTSLMAPKTDCLQYPHRRRIECRFVRDRQVKLLFV
ncbi:hypothetical protein RAB80_018330 [Fusarium oxysporum f. sp. vasinfectum]|nr:hypothetical protein RAB80_018330 [Fusarium oxysporum f. sp. vasinfectum]